MHDEKSRNSSLFGGLIILCLGILFLLQNLDILHFGEAWPLILVTVGLALIIEAIVGSKKGSKKSSPPPE